MGRDRRILTANESETLNFGIEIGKRLVSSSIVCLFGEMGSGKTTLIKGIVNGAIGMSPDEVNSPTFIYLNIYGEKKCVYHFDLYRLACAEEFLSLGFEEYFDKGGICLIEWSERIYPLIPNRAESIHISYVNETTRKIELCQTKLPNF